MPNNQIEKGYDFTTGQLVTADNLDNLAQEATLKKGAISEQPALSGSVDGTDELLIHDVSDTVQPKPKKATVTQLLNSGVNATLGSITVTSVTSSNNLAINTTDGPVVTATGYTYVSNNVVTVASSAHGLVAGDYIEITCSNALFSGRYRVDTVPSVNSFTYKVFGTVTASNGTCTWKRVGNIITNGNSYIDDDVNVGKDLSVGGRVRVLGDKSILLPKGTTAARPTNPEAGEIRYNSTLNRAEVYDGTIWKELGAAPFEASGGDIVLAPSTTVTAATFTSTDSGKQVVITITAGHDICMGQVIDLQTAITGYSGEYVVTSADQFTVGFRRSGDNLANVSNIACTVRKAGNHKIHIFKQTGNLVVGDNDGFADVLIVGGGGGRGTAFRWTAQGGGSGGVLLKRGVKLNKNTTYQCIVGAGGLSNDSDGNGNEGGTSALIVSGQSTTSYVYATGGGAGVAGDTGWSGYTSDNAHLAANVRSYLGTTHGDWQNFSNACAGAGGGQSRVPRAGYDSVSINTNQMLPAGVVSDITNIPVMYAPSGGDNACTRSWPSSLDDGMHSTVAEKGFRAIGIGASGAGSSEPFKPNHGRAGIVIVRYPFRLQT